MYLGIWGTGGGLGTGGTVNAQEGAEKSARKKIAVGRRNLSTLKLFYMNLDPFGNYNVAGGVQRAAAGVEGENGIGRWVHNLDLGGFDFFSFVYPVFNKIPVCHNYVDVVAVLYPPESSDYVFGVVAVDDCIAFAGQGRIRVERNAGKRSSPAAVLVNAV